MATRSPSDGSGTDREFTIADVAWLHRIANHVGVECWLVGGWGVDALLGTQTRPHADLDIVIEKPEHEVLRDALEAHGFRVLRDEHAREWNYVLVDEAGRAIDFHVIRFDEAGRGFLGPSFVYPVGSLKERGVVGETPVRCATPWFQIEDHSGYELHEEDLLDVRALCHRFKLPLPREFRP